MILNVTVYNPYPVITSCWTNCNKLNNLCTPRLYQSYQISFDIISVVIIGFTINRITTESKTYKTRL